MSTTPEQILDNAADYIHEHGWCQGALFDDEGRACLQGAVIYGAGMVGVPVTGTACPQLLDAWRAVFIELGCRNPVTWNDVRCRDADDAIHLLKRARERL